MGGREGAQRDGLQRDVRAAEERGPALPRAAADRLGFLFVALADQLEQRSERPLAELGMDGHDYTVLAILVVDGPGTQNDIARLMNRAPTVVVAAVDKLERKGLVERKRDPADRRRSRVTPTRAGLAALSDADAIGRRLVAAALDDLTADEIALLHGLLRRGLRLESLSDAPEREASARGVA